MTVKELIKELGNYDPEYEAVINWEGQEKEINKDCFALDTEEKKLVIDGEEGWGYWGKKRTVHN